MSADKSNEKYAEKINEFISEMRKKRLSMCPDFNQVAFAIRNVFELYRYKLSRDEEEIERPRNLNPLLEI